jgi:hypothetical protein
MTRLAGGLNVCAAVGSCSGGSLSFFDPAAFAFAVSENTLKPSVREIWRHITSTRRTRALESELARHGAELTRQRGENDQQRAIIASQQNEIARLRAENRALLNSILGIAGIPPILQEGLPGRRLVEPGRSDTPPPDFAALPSSVSLPTKCHSESAAADDESRSARSFPSSATAEKNSPGAQRPRNDIPPNPSPESSSLRSSSRSSSSPPSPRRRQLATPLRRRSWYQIMRTLEFESGKKKAATD